MHMIYKATLYSALFGTIFGKLSVLIFVKSIYYLDARFLSPSSALQQNLGLVQIARTVVECSIYPTVTSGQAIRKTEQTPRLSVWEK